MLSQRLQGGARLLKAPQERRDAAIPQRQRHSGAKRQCERDQAEEARLNQRPGEAGRGGTGHTGRPHQIEIPAERTSRHTGQRQQPGRVDDLGAAAGHPAAEERRRGHPREGQQRQERLQSLRRRQPLLGRNPRRRRLYVDLHRHLHDVLRSAFALAHVCVFQRKM